MKDKESSDNMPTRKIRIQAKWIIATFALSALIILPALLKFAFSIKISSDWLSYYGTCLATVGTVFLGAVALWQNQELNRKDKEAKEYLEQQKKEAIKPKIECENIITKNLNLIVSLSNNQKNEACNICVENASELSFPKKVIIAPLRLKQIIPSLKASQSTQLVFDQENAPHRYNWKEKKKHIIFRQSHRYLPGKTAGFSFPYSGSGFQKSLRQKLRPKPPVSRQPISLPYKR